MNEHAGYGALAVPVDPTDHALGPETAKVTLVEASDFA